MQNSYFYNAYAEAEGAAGEVFVKSGGHIFARQGRRIARPAGREDWLLFFVERGCERFFLEREVEAGEGGFILFAPGEAQEHLTVSEGTAEFFYIHFVAPADFDTAGLKTSTVYTTKRLSHTRAVFEEIITELQTKQHGYARVTLSCLHYLIATLAREAVSKSDAHEKHLGELSAVIQLMSREYEKDYSLADYAAVCHMSKFHFLRVFREITGASPIEYRNAIRLSHAKELLSDTDLSVSEIATAVGFSGQSYFCDAFKRRVGLSPTAYRREKQG